MEKIIALFMAGLLPTTIYAGCDLTKFRWGCSAHPKIKNVHRGDALIYCGNTRLYVSKEQFNLIRHYQSAGVHMSIKVNDVYYDGPCVAARHNMNLQKPHKVHYF